MKRAWIGVALLSASWLLGVSYYHAARWLVWVIVLVPGVLLLWGAAERKLPRALAVAAGVMLLPMVAVAPWPYRAAPVLIVIGLAIQLAPLPRRWPGRLAAGLIAAGVVLLAQSVAIVAYEAFTARFHELPSSLGWLLGEVGRLVGLDAAAYGGDLSLFSMRKIHRLGATWGLLADPLSWCFLVGGAAFVLLKAPAGQGPVGLIRRVARFAVPVLLWLPVRSCLLMAIYLHRVLRTGYDDPLIVLVDQFWDRWVHMLLLIPPALLAWRFAGAEEAPAETPPAAPADEPLAPAPAWKPWVPAALSLAAVAVFVAAAGWDPAGQRKGGRVLVDEYRSQLPWPRKTFDTVRTDKPFDTEWYGHDSAYNHYCLYEYCNRFFTMSRQMGPLTEDALAGCDVLLLKVPSGAYSPKEIDLICDFVERGGGLLLLGEHTSVYGSGVYLNRIAERFGFRFRYDCAFGIDSVFEQLYKPPLLPHPIIQRMPPMHFATSCTIDPGATGRAVIRATGLKSLSADYHASNFYPQAKDNPEMRYGAFVQLLTTRRGAGRVAAFTDSTIFSNFCVFEPGKSDVMVGMLDWLNHRNTMGDPRPWLIALGVALLAAAVVLGAKWRASWLVMLAAGALGWSLGVPGVRAVNRRALPGPPQIRHMVRVGIDRTVCDANMPKNGFIAGRRTHFGQFERSILRLGYFTFRGTGQELDKANVIVFLRPNLSVPAGFKEQLKKFVADGGKLLVMDSPSNARSTANRLLHPFGLEIKRPYRPIGGALSVPGDWPAPTVKSAKEVAGGTPFAKIGTRTVGAWARYNKGKVWAIGFGDRFTDMNMGFIGDVTPKGDLIDVFRLVYKLLRVVAEDTPTTAPVARPPGTVPPTRGTRRTRTYPRRTPAPKRRPAPAPKPVATKPVATKPAATRPAPRTQPARRSPAPRR